MKFGVIVPWLMLACFGLTASDAAAEDKPASTATSQPAAPLLRDSDEASPSSQTIAIKLNVTYVYYEGIDRKKYPDPRATVSFYNKTPETIGVVRIPPTYCESELHIYTLDGKEVARKPDYEPFDRNTYEGSWSATRVDPGRSYHIAIPLTKCYNLDKDQEYIALFVHYDAFDHSPYKSNRIKFKLADLEKEK